MASNNSSFRATQWDPVLILSQIVCLQAIWYTSISTIVFTLFKFSGSDITLDAILNYREIRADNAQGMLLGLAWLLNSVVGVYLLLKIVARARLVLDFSLTLLLYHVIMTSLYSDHLPTTFLWWALNGTTAGIMIFGGEYVCMQQEMEPILLGGASNQQSGSGDGQGSNSNNRSDSSNSNSNPGSSNNGSGSGSNSSNNSNQNSANSGHHLSQQGAALASMYSDGYGFDETAELLMDTFDGIPADRSSRAMPQKTRSSESTGVIRSGRAANIRSSVLGGQNHGRQRTSDGYKVVSASDAGV
ncbi:integral membrane protein S linking to the trans Golgi network-domain-containing protein [Gamsiella multidivaricata]|uniref:integral membrane protein S linking to the trans Golgi network-domain-containing protein n=1 Tax=Gamsiella multidivaricata TaxID=101098 RepID=UPI00221EAEFF|nr:integral membrane protein S linking to the trans Golgi network-domain-containing protein [Gamsiella multidivaricata]KAG0360338.1 hypothetical protein BGZ54_009600 [Gamsiella multidivaricata]KAI7828596.1 integral membrane protein S linking to the trans Golgi network-domain-containing protein [Gamsiella multidivaricata]